MDSRSTRIPLAALGLALAAPALSAKQSDVSFVAMLLRETPGEGRNVVLACEDPSAMLRRPAALQGIELLDVDFSNRTELFELVPDRPRRVADVGSRNRLVLPADGGALYAYRREADGVRRFGYMHVPENGLAHSVLEFAGIGEDGEDSPFVDKLAVAADGLTVLVATRPDAGGDLLHVDLGRGTYVDRTPLLAPQDFGGSGLFLGAGWGFGISSEGVLRFDALTDAPAEFVSFPAPQPIWFAREAALSDNGVRAVTLAGTSQDAACPFVFARTGTAACADPTPRAVQGAGYLPEALDGPFLAVSDSGLDCAWVTVEGTSRELWLARDLPPVVQPSFHVTQDALFHPHLDEIGLLSFRLGALHFSAGDRASVLHGGLTASSYYRAQHGAPGTAPQIQDLAHSYANSSPPFLDYAQHEPLAVRLAPNRSTYVVLARDGGNQVLSAIPMTGHSGASFTVLDAFENLPLLQVAGDRLLFAVHEDGSNVEGRLFEMPADLSAPPTELLALAEEDVHAQTAKSSGLAGFVSPGEHWGEVESLWHLGAQGQAPIRLPLVRGEYGHTLAVTARGSLAFTVRSSNPQVDYAFLWPSKRRPRLLLEHASRIQLLPAN